MTLQPKHNYCVYKPRQLHRRQPDSKQSQINFKLAAQKRVASSSSQHGGKDGCTLNLCCKFEINLRLFAIWLVTIKFTPLIARWIWGHSYFISTSQIANDLKFAIQTE